MALVLSTVPAPAAASSTTLTVLAGSVTLTSGGRSLSAVSGDLVRPGEEVSTSTNGHAVLTFVDGSTTVLEPGSKLLLEEASIRQGSVAVRMFQSVGLTWSSVSRLLAPGSRFEVRTPAVTASVRGTAFEVEVAADGDTRVRTSEGTVAVSNDQGEVIVRAGSETTAAPGAPPAPPSTPPSTPRRTLEIGGRAVLIVDALGRACGQADGKVVQQIPGCTVRDGEIRIEDVARAGDYRIAVVADPGDDRTVVERTTAATGETVREVTLPATVATAAPVASTARPTIQVTLPLGIGTVPVQLDIASAAPVVRTAPPDAAAGSFEAPRLQLPTLPFGRATDAPSATPSTAPTVPLPTTSIAPVIQTVVPTIVPTAAPTVVPTNAVPTVTSPIRIVSATPTPEPTAQPTAEPTPTPLITLPPSVLPSVGLATATPTPAPTATATPSPTSTPTPTPTPEPTPTPCPEGYTGTPPLCVPPVRLP